MGGARARLLLVLLGLASAAPGAAAEPGSAVERLAAAIRFPTVSPQDPADFDPAPFLAFHGFLTRSFPAVHTSLEREVVNDLSLLYTWRGSDPTRAPILLTSHFDVVPVLPEQLERWEQPPFAGAVADGFVWGRGALDDKVGVLGILEAVEGLLAEGFAPGRTVYLAFGHDEEIGGEAGAGPIAALLRERGVRLEFTLDEGLAIVEGAVPGIEGPVAMIGVAEKGYMTLRITATALGGHSSVPPRHTAIGRLARAITRLEDRPVPARLDGPAAGLLDALAPHGPLWMRAAVAGRWLLGPLILRALARDPTTDALARTTTAVTMIAGGAKENVLPPSATATVNFRLRPGDSVESVITHVRAAVDDPELAFETVRGSEASPVASTDSPAFSLLRDTIVEVVPEAIVAPGLTLGGTDTRHYVGLAENSYRFVPLRLRQEDVARIHGLNERVSVESYGRAIDFYARLLRRGAS